MINVTRSCDICGKNYVKINVKYKTKGLIKRFGLQGWQEADICDCCIDTIKKLVEEKQELTHEN